MQAEEESKKNKRLQDLIENFKLNIETNEEIQRLNEEKEIIVSAKDETYLSYIELEKTLNKEKTAYSEAYYKQIIAQLSQRINQLLQEDQ